MSAQPDLGPYLHEFAVDAKTLADHADEAARLHASGDLQGACEVVAISHYKLSQVADERENLLRLFGERGIEPSKPR